MSILIGIITSQDQGIEEGIVRSALLSAGSYTKSTTTIITLPRCCMGKVSFAREISPEAKAAKQGASLLMWTGYITDICTLSERLKGAGGVLDGRSDAEILLASYLQYGIESLQGLNGLYAIVIWDDTRRCFSALTDRYGITKLYYWLGPDFLMFASECKAILHHPKYHKAIDKEAVVNFMGAGYCFGDKTLFKDIKLIPQGCKLTYKDRSLSLTKYWNYSVKPAKGNLDEYTEEFYSHLKSAFERCVSRNKEVFIPVSGGLDSRTIAAVAHDCNKIISGCTVGFIRSRDVRYGTMIGERLCAQHTVLPLSTQYIAHYGTSGVKLSEGTVANHSFFILRILDCSPVPTIMATGYLGDVLTGKNLSAGMSNNEETMKRKFIRAFRCAELGDILDPSFRHLIGVNSAYWNKSLQEADAEAFTDKLMINALQERQRRYTSFLVNYLGRELNAVAPFADNSLLDFMLCIPTEFRIQQNLYKNMIVKNLPLVADIPLDMTGTRMSSTWWSWRWEYFKRMVPKSLKRIFDRQDNQNWVVDCDDSIRTGSAAYFSELFSLREYMTGLFNMDAVDGLFKEHMEGRISIYEKLSAIATLLEWRRQFGI